MSKQEFLDEILKINHKYSEELLGKAYDVAAKMHKGQFRKSGEPYLTHPMEVVKILAELGMDEDALVAGLLHDVVEDSSYTSEQLAREFGSEVALLVEGVTKMTELAYENKDDRQAETIKKMFLAMSKDIRVLIIKLADRLHNLRTIYYMTSEKIQEKCTETLEIYAPLANRLGIYSIKSELEDIAMSYIWPEEYEYIKQQIYKCKEDREENLNKIMNEIQLLLQKNEIDYEIQGRTKNFYSVFRKMKYKHKRINEIFDLTAVRVIVDTIKDCYLVLGIIHSKWNALPGRFKDYIATPKPNMYRSIHTTVFGHNNIPFEIQIRTREMHIFAEYGIAAHWKYKEGVESAQEEERLSWIRQSLEWQKETDTPTEFLETLKMDLFDNKVFVFSPQGRPIELPLGSTPLDFAFKIHSEVGAKCVGAKINGKMVPIDHILQNGDVIEIVTSNNAKGPTRDWLKIVKSPTARTKIKQCLKRENREEFVEKGKIILERLIKQKHANTKEVLTHLYLGRILKEKNLKTEDELYKEIATAGNIAGSIASKLIEFYNQEHIEKEKSETIEIAKKTTNHNKKSKNGILVEGMDGCLVRVAKCCNPVPGDEIIGFITKGNGVSVHKKDCSNVMSFSDEQKRCLIPVQWANQSSEIYETSIMIKAVDSTGIFAEVSKVCINESIKIIGVQAKSTDDNIAEILLTVEITGVHQVGKLMTAIKSLDGVLEIYRS